MRLTSKSIPEKMTFSAIFNDFKQLNNKEIKLKLNFLMEKLHNIEINAPQN